MPDLIVSAINQPDGAQVAVWDGIGGDLESQLIQAGVMATYHDVNSTSGNQQWATYGAWWEALPDKPGTVEVSLAIYPGDTMYVSCTYNPSTGNTSFYIEDESDGQVASFPEPTSNDYIGNKAEWVTERPKVYPVNNIYPYTFLADFGSEPFTGSTVVDNGTDYAIGNDNPNLTTMYDNSGTVLANASSLTTSSSYTDYWHSYGDRQ